MAWWHGTPHSPSQTKESKIKEHEAATKLSLQHKNLYATASALIWGSGRNFPTSLALTSQLAVALGVNQGAQVALIGAGAGDIGRTLLEKFDVKLTNYEADPIIKSLSEATIKASHCHKNCVSLAYDGQFSSLLEGQADAAIMFYKGGQVARVEAGAFTLLRLLKPGAQGIWLDLFSNDGEVAIDLAHGIEKRLFTPVDIFKSAASAAGLTINSVIDCDAYFLAAISSCLNVTLQDFESRQAELKKAGENLAASFALHSIVTWKARAEAVRTGKLCARFVVVSAPL
ncbi:hypothetical protein PsB1_1571 [Candidatus Phycosocius spiralis]|uniref:Methyltransferase domain-containing protein n=1 Tax=Candidatus Phycosocius spiralis TaxID=2815099 RepID=A0ABQ4PWM1_9PROT|nr:hypothetical protein PsB1_1571 [Candidatus Phycosocius spiralis]